MRDWFQGASGIQIMDLEWKKNFITKAIQYKRDMIPVHFTGRNSDFFYRLHSLRKFLGIKANLEMLYLVDETYKHRNDHLTVTFGKPIPLCNFRPFKNTHTVGKMGEGTGIRNGGYYRYPFIKRVRSKCKRVSGKN